MQLARQQRESFLETLWAHYALHGRPELPWRLPEPDGAFDPYKILVSELMLQQTQVPRVIPKYTQFLAQFPEYDVLAASDLGAVLKLWQGLGYNRRAKFLWQAAQQLHQRGSFPDTQSDLISLPGIGKNTAGAIAAYAFNQPVLFIETNIRTVYIHHFFSERSDVHDNEIIELLEQTLDREQPREFYWALMDYGAYLKQYVRNNSQSRHYTKQSTFDGSLRQVRGKVLRALSDSDLTFDQLYEQVHDPRLETVITALMKEALISERAGKFTLG